MEKWQHMTLVTVKKQGEPRLDITLTGPDRGYTTQPSETDQSLGDATLRHLDELGEKGWQLVSIDRDNTAEGLKSTFWLKRRVE